METGRENGRTLGWVGAGGRMGRAMAGRLLDAGHEVLVYNRTRERVASLVERGAIAVESPTDLADCGIVFVTVGGDKDFIEVVSGERGVASGSSGPAIVVDHTTVSSDASATVRERLAARGTMLLAAPVSGNAKVIDAGLLSIVVSGPEAAFDQARPYLEALGRQVSYVGDGELARLVKICHNVYLGIVIQGLVEITVLAEKAGIRRSDMLNFINTSVMGSIFSGYKAPALVNLDFTPTFTMELLLKDLTLGLDSARDLGVPLPVASMVQQLVRSAVGEGLGEVDFAALIELQARGAGLELVADDVPVKSSLEAHLPEPVG